VRRCEADVGKARQRSGCPFPIPQSSRSSRTPWGRQDENRSAFEVRRPGPLNAVQRSLDPSTAALRRGATFGNMAERTSLPDGIGQLRALA
jgi:hypothetical protein